ncbi:MAG: ABC transporter transmembrane domain-containing protein, partial [Deltaproteobacteria bacterium]
MNRIWSDARRLILLLWPYARAHKGLLVAGGFLSAAVIALRLAQPWPLKLVIDSLSGGTPSIPWLPSDPVMGVLLMSLSYVAIATLGGLADYWQLILLTGLGNRILFSFRNRLFRQVLSHSVAFHEHHDVGELVTRVVSDTSRLRRGVNGVLVRSLQVLFTFLSSIAVVLWLDWRLGIVVGFLGGVSLLIMGRTGRRILRASRKNRRREGQLAGIVAEDVQGIQELQVFRTQELG